MGISMRHVVMIGFELDAIDLTNPDEQMSEFYAHEAKAGSFALFEDSYSGEYQIFGKVLEISNDGRYDEASLSFARRYMKETDRLEVIDKIEEIFPHVKNVDPKLYVFTHFS